MIRLIIMECFFDEKRHNVRLIEQSRNNRYVKKKIVLENFDDFEDWRATSWKRSGEGGNKFPSQVSYQA